METIKRLLFCALYIALIGIVSHPIGNLLGRHRFRADRAPWRSFAWEDGGRFWRRLGVHKWKDKVPDMSKLLPDMVRKQVALTDGAAQFDALINETCVAELVHYALAVCSAAVMWILPNALGVAVWLLCLLGNLPFAVIQRYNRPRLLKVRNRLQSKRAGG